jgi:hypothetical protein
MEAAEKVFATALRDKNKFEAAEWEALERCVYLVNSTPKYYFMLPLHFALIERYGSFAAQDMHKVLATEVPDHPICRQLAEEYGVEILPIRAEEAGFLESRAAALRALAAQGRWEFVLPMQEDFLLDRRDGMADWIRKGAMSKLKAGRGVASVRLMPCPGPKKPQSEMAAWWDLDRGYDEYGFVFQATLWRLDSCLAWYEAITERLERMWPKATTPPARRREIEIGANFAENADGQRFFWELFEKRGERHMAWVRAGPWSNAVYLCPWPYRPTAIVRGKVEPWAAEMARREGMPFAAEVTGQGSG